MLADALGKEFLDEGIVPLVHFTCKDRSRNQIISQLYGMERQGIENILFMTGDYQVTGWDGRARPVFDLDSVHLQMIATEMNNGLVVPGRKGPITEKQTHFFNGGVVNPFKYLEGEVIPQYLKMEKKIIGGAKFLITQLGYDARKMEELIRYRNDRGFDTAIIGNIFSSVLQNEIASASATLKRPCLTLMKNNSGKKIQMTYSILAGTLNHAIA